MQKPKSNNPVQNRKQVCSQQHSVLCPYCPQFLKSLLAHIKNNPTKGSQPKSSPETIYGHPDLIQGHPQLSQGSSYKKKPFSPQNTPIAEAKSSKSAKQSFSKPLEKDTSPALADNRHISTTPSINPDKGTSLSPCHNKRPHLPLSCPYLGNCICCITRTDKENP